MTPAQLVPLVLQISIAVIVFANALRSQPGDLTYLWRRPSLFARSILSMNVLMPFLAALAAKLFHLRPEIELTLILLAVSPVPPILTGKQGKAGGNVSYGIGLLMTSALVALVAAPLSITLIGRWFGFDLHVPVAVIAKVLLISVIVPLALGAFVARAAPGFAARAAKPLTMLAMIVLLLGLVLILIATGRAILAQIGDFTLVAIILFTLAGLAIGHLLGGPEPENRTVLALATACRHPGVAVAIASVVVPGNKAITATVLLALLVGAVATGPYVKWRKKAGAA